MDAWREKKREIRERRKGAGRMERRRERGACTPWSFGLYFRRSVTRREGRHGCELGKEEGDGRSEGRTHAACVYGQRMGEESVVSCVDG